MVDLEKLQTWVQEHPEEAAEPFMSITTQRKVTLQGIYDELAAEQETGIAIVDEDLLSVIREVDDWLREV